MKIFLWNQKFNSVDANDRLIDLNVLLFIPIYFCFSIFSFVQGH